MRRIVAKYVNTTPFRVLHNLSLTIYSRFIKMTYLYNFNISSIEGVGVAPAF